MQPASSSSLPRGARGDPPSASSSTSRGKRRPPAATGDRTPVAEQHKALAASRVSQLHGTSRLSRGAGGCERTPRLSCTPGLTEGTPCHHTQPCSKPCAATGHTDCSAAVPARAASAASASHRKGTNLLLSFLFLRALPLRHKAKHLRASPISPRSHPCGWEAAPPLQRHTSIAHSAARLPRPSRRERAPLT